MFERIFLKVTLIALTMCLWGTAALAQTVTDDMVNDVAKGLFCPVCESEPLDTCATQACKDWRDEIRVQLSQGRTQAEIYADFQTRYGDRVLAEPPAAGFNLALWLTIPIALLIGGILFIRYLQQIKSRSTSNTVSHNEAPRTTTPRATSDYIEQIEDEVRNR